MVFLRRRSFVWLALLASLLLLYLWSVTSISTPRRMWSAQGWSNSQSDASFWKTIATRHPPDSIRSLPTTSPVKYPEIQTAALSAKAEAADVRGRREERQRAVKETFAKCWTAYREHAWISDELAPVSGGRRNPFGGWAATLVDSLDTLWIMDMRSEFQEAVAAAVAINFTRTDLDEINVFETNIRYLGGFLAAYDLSGDVRLLRKAVEVGEMLYKAFDTPNRMPITRWDIHAAMQGKEQVASSGVLVAEVGSLSMEFTRLSQLTGDPKWFDAMQRIMDDMAAQQDLTLLPGLWPLVVDAENRVFNKGSVFTLGAMADSVYEYLPKMSALTGGQLPIYQTMYEKAVAAAVKHNLFRPMTPNNENILISGTAHVEDGGIRLEPQGQHLVCFLGGLMALAGKLFDRVQDLSVAAKLVDGCVWAYKTFPHGIMPETFSTLPCQSTEHCEWDEAKWKQQDRLPPGITAIPDRRYILRPEAIESVFVLYRATGRADLVESAWDMFNAINQTTSTKLANSAAWDVTVPKDEKPPLSDSMESFWLGETLKYFYLVFSEPSLISLDEFVFNTEAHPFRRLVG